jgi:hypothetical protein
MVKKSKSSTTKPTEWADILGPARDFEAAVTKTRSLYDLPIVGDGAKEIALLSIFKEEQRFAFHPVMRALQRLSELTDWSPSFFVCDRIESEFFDWRTMPLRQYSSFQDFYHRELEATWGKWEELQHTYAQIVRGEISDVDADAKQKLDNAERAKKANAADLENVRPVGRPAKQLDLLKNVSIEKSDTHNNQRPSTGSAARALRKLREDRPDIHQRVLDGEITANAGMVEAGFRKKQPSRKMTVVERFLKLWAKATDDERAEIRAEIDG